jgi:DNA-binding MarR family transcriptional regulator
MSTVDEPGADPAAGVVTPALLRAARGAYSHAVRSRLVAGGFEDLPANGPYVLGGMVNQGGTPGDLIRQLGVSRQAASQLVETLVVRGYLTRDIDESDRRRVTLEATERGRAAAAAVRDGVVSVDLDLAGRLTPQQLYGFRAGLAALCEIREDLEAELEWRGPEG